MSIKHTFKIAILTSALWVVALIAILVCFDTRKVNATLDKDSYRESDFSRWIMVPDSISKIHTHFYAGRDTNYRVLLLEGDIGDSRDLIEKSIQRNVQYSSEEIIWMEKMQYSLEGFFSSFRYGEEAIPKWWVDFSLIQKYKATIAYWTHEGRGYGYLVLYDRKSSLVLQFSQQHLSESTLRRAFLPKTTLNSTDG